MAEPSKHAVQETIKLIKQTVRPGSVWHPVDAGWLRKVQVFYDLVRPGPEDDREFPGKHDNSNIVDPDYPMCIRRGTTEGDDFIWVPEAAFRSLDKLFGRVPGQDPLARKAFQDEATFDIRIEAFPQLCRLSFASAKSCGQPMNVWFEDLRSRSETVSKLVQWAVGIATSPGEGAKPLLAKASDPSMFRLWVRNEPPSELVEAGKEPPREPFRLADPGAQLEAIAANDRCTDLLLERFASSCWPRGCHVRPGEVSPLEEHVEAAAAAAAGESTARFDRGAWLKGLRPLSRLDCADKFGDWFEAEVVKVMPTGCGEDGSEPGVHVHFRAWSDSFDEAVALSSLRLQPPWSMLRNFRDPEAGEALQVQLPSEKGNNWWDGIVVKVRSASVDVRVAKKHASAKTVTMEKDDPLICAPGVHAQSTNRKATPLVAETGKWLAPSSSSSSSSPSSTATPPTDGLDGGDALAMAEAPAAANSGNGHAAPSVPPDVPPAPLARRSSGYGAVSFIRGIDDADVATTTQGAVGLRNVGNTCFMNSMVQCLSNTEPLSRFFLDRKSWMAEVNPDNPLGFRGKLARAYASLLEELWLGRHASVAPSLLKDVVSRNAPQFRGYQQHDSQELMSYLLDGLHEDCNRVRKKQLTEKVESDGRPDAVVAAEAWEVHRMRNRSHVQDVIGGQLRSHIECNHCGNVSLTFDPFTSLSVPIPVPERVRRVCTCVPHGPGTALRVTMYPRIELTYLEFEIALRNEPADFDESPEAGFTTASTLDALAASGPSTPQVRASFAWAKVANLDNRHNRVLQWVNPDEPMRNVDDDDFVFCFMLPGRSPEQWDRDTQPWERGEEGAGAGATSAAAAATTSSSSAPAPESSSSSSSSLAVPGAPLKREASGTRGVVSRVRHPTGALVVSMTTQKKGLEVSYHFPHIVYLPLVQAFQDSSWDAAAATEAKQDPNATPSQRSVMRAVWEQVRQHASDKQLAADDTLGAENPPYACFLVPADAEPVAGNTADPRNKSADADTFVQADDERAVAIDPTSDEPFPIRGDECARWVLRLFWRPWGPEGARKVGTRVKGEYGALSRVYKRGYGSVEKGGKDDITLHDCMKEFVLREQLGKDDKWYCPKCKEFVRAYKKFDLFNVGEVLIVHLKRFRYSRVITSSYFGASAVREKISELVDFPVEGLDLSSVVMGPQPGPHVYDLYAVSEHSGGLGGGHYTATARNWLNGRWYDFNDSFVREARSSASAVSPSAYVLFYRRRRGPPMRVPLPHHIKPDGTLNDKDEEVRAALEASKA